MSNPIMLNNSTHRNINIDTKKIEQLAARERMIPVVISEFLKLSVQYPIAFIKNSDTGRFLAVAIFGIEEGENLFWENGQWSGVYTPLNIMRQPFSIGTDESNGNEKVICIDTDSPCISRTGGARIFDDEGKETAFLEQAKSILSEIHESEIDTNTFIQCLLEHQLMKSVSLNITLANKEALTVQGIYTIDEEKLESLDKEETYTLHNKNYLKLIYIMIASMGHTYTLIDRKNKTVIAAA
ncbi:MAG: hypothetical protein ACI93R_000152 [Flavobacteriales bacterium]|jgi:hypothetical protein